MEAVDEHEFTVYCTTSPHVALEAARRRQATMLRSSYNVMYNAGKRLPKSYAATERAAMFHDPATRVYRIDG